MDPQNQTGLRPAVTYMSTENESTLKAMAKRHEREAEALRMYPVVVKKLAEKRIVITPVDLNFFQPEPPKGRGEEVQQEGILQLMENARVIAIENGMSLAEFDTLLVEAKTEIVKGQISAVMGVTPDVEVRRAAREVIDRFDEDARRALQSGWDPQG